MSRRQDLEEARLRGGKASRRQLLEEARLRGGKASRRQGFEEVVSRGLEEANQSGAASQSAAVQQKDESVGDAGGAGVQRRGRVEGVGRGIRR